jgi:hypothetical protein
MVLSAAGLNNDRGDRGRRESAFNLALDLGGCRLLGGVGRRGLGFDSGGRIASSA